MFGQDRGERTYVVRFWKKVYAVFQSEFYGDFIRRVAAGINDFKVGLIGYKAGGQINTAFGAGQNDVGQKKIDLAAMLRPNMCGLGIAFGGERVVTELAQQFGSKLGQAFFIFNDQDGLRFAFARWRRGARD